MIKLSRAVDGLEMLNDDFQYFINIETEEIEFLPNHLGDIDEDEEEILEKIEQSDKYYKLPDQFEINEYQIMENFAYSLKDQYIKNKLLTVLNRRKPFRNFKAAICNYDVRDAYFEFRTKAYYQIAEAWCQAKGIEYSTK